MHGKKIASLLLAASLVFGMVGCGKSGGDQSKATNTTETKTEAKKPVEITFWHAMGGVNGDAVKAMVDAFNKAHPDIVVTAQFQGTYDDAINKLKTSMAGKAGPDVCQIYDIGTRFMIDSKWTVPVEQYMDNDKSFNKNDLEPNLLSYYTVDNKLNSMPFNSSTPILYYNKNAFKEAGLDPNTAPKNFDEILDYSKKLTKKDGGKVTQYGFSMAIYGWFFEQLIAKQGALYANNGNGRSTQKATAVEWDKNGAGLNIVKEWKTLVDSGYVGNFGRKTDDTKNAFSAGRTAMILESTAALGGLKKAAGGRFEIGTAYLPSLGKSDKGGVIIGGGSLWMMNNGNEDKQKAAWEFIKFAVSPEQQAAWNKATGYFAVNKKAYDLQIEKDLLQASPEFKTAIDQLHSTPVNEFTSGAVLGVFPEARAAAETNIENVLQNKQTPEQAIQVTAKTVNDAITNYNNTNK